MNQHIAVVGLGYVGLPLAIEFAKKYPTIGFDINTQRTTVLKLGVDTSGEVGNDELQYVLDQKGFKVTDSWEAIATCNVYVITVPTPVDKTHHPDLGHLLCATSTVAKILKKGDLVIYESSVYPGATEEECVPLLEKVSGLRFNSDFFVGYSPERVNPGDKENRVANIKKVTSGSTPETALAVDALYSSIIMAGTHLAPTIKVAEAAKVIENAQRDINIAFVNELAKIFNVLNIDTREVLEAAKTKWNFLPFEPGLVGGNCIGVDPYYLAQRAQQAGYHSEIILAGRRMNDGMGQYVATEVIKMMMKSGTPMKRAKILMLGIAFKENCSDIGNTRVVDIYNSLRQFDLQIDVFDPYVDRNQVKSELGIDMIDAEKFTKYDMIILAVAHDKFLHMDLGHMKSENGLVYDVKGVLEQELVDKRL